MSVLCVSGSVPGKTVSTSSGSSDGGRINGWFASRSEVGGRVVYCNFHKAGRLETSTATVVYKEEQAHTFDYGYYYVVNTVLNRLENGSSYRKY